MLHYFRRKINNGTALGMLGHQPGPVPLLFWPGQLGFPVPLFFSAGTRPGASIYFSTMAVTLFFTASVHRGNAVTSRFSSKSYAWLGLAGRFHYFFSAGPAGVSGSIIFFRPGQLSCPVPLFIFGPGRLGCPVPLFYLASRKINNGTAGNIKN